MKSNCLWYALDKWTEEGGTLGLVKSTHWCIPHVQHYTKDMKLSHFVPYMDLKAPWYSIFGFEGSIQYTDSSIRERMSPICMFLGTCILFISGAFWFINRILFKRWRQMLDSAAAPSN